MEFHFHFYFLFFVYLWHWKTDLNFVFRFLFSPHFEKGIWISVFLFRFSPYFEKRIWLSFFVFRFLITLKNGFEFWFSYFFFLPYFEKRICLVFFIFCSRIRFEKRIWISFFTFRFCTCGISSFSLPKAWKPVISVFWWEYQTVMAALEGVLDEDFVRCFLTQQKKILSWRLTIDIRI